VKKLSSYNEKKQEANELRKAQNFKSALKLYRELWSIDRDPFVGAGLLHCLRKLKLFDEAIPFADTLIEQFSDIDWIRIEFTWTYIMGLLQKFDANDPLEKVLQTAMKIMAFNPDGLARNKVVLKTMKLAKAANEWDLVNEWAEKVNPEELSMRPIPIKSGKEAWSNQAIWYNLRLQGLLNTNRFNEVIELVNSIEDKFPKQNKFFLRLKAKALIELNKLNEAEKIFRDLCSIYRPDWWLLYDYAKVLKQLDRKEEALKLMYQAAAGNPNLGTLVTLFLDIGDLCRELGLNEEARAHYILCQLIRSKKQWSISSLLTDNISELNEILENNNFPKTIKEVLDICKQYWGKLSNKKKIPVKRFKNERKPKQNLQGILSLKSDGRPYCFINTEEGESYFCSKVDLPSGVVDGSKVIFDAIPSFDKKKKKKSWRASNIR